MGKDIEPISDLESTATAPQDDVLDIGYIGINWYNKIEDKLEELGWPIDRINSLLLTTREYYFQKREDAKDKKTDEPIHCYRITVAIEEDVFLQMDCKLNRRSSGWDLYAEFFVHNIVMPPFLPESDFKKVRCARRCNCEIVNDKFKSFLSEVDTLPITQKGSRLERESKLWHTYTNALRKLVQEKERFFSINEIDMPESGLGKDGEDVANISIRISEKKPQQDYGLISEDFLYYTPKQYKEMLELRKSAHGENIDGEKAVKACKLGRLVKQNGLYELVFEADKSFMELMNQHTIGKEKIAEFQKGYIAPTFTLEYANIKRMETAMEKIVHPGERCGYPANAHLSRFIFDSSLAELPTEDYEDVKAEIRQYCQEKRLNERQLEAVTKAIIAPELAIIQGPPGTGKTTVISEIIRQTIHRNPKAKILLSSQTHVAVDNALGRLAKCQEIFPLRIGRTERMEPEGLYCSDEIIQAWGGEKVVPNRWLVAIQDNIVAKKHQEVERGCSQAKKDHSACVVWREWLNNRDARREFCDGYEKLVNLLAATCSECGSARFSERYKSLFEQEGKTFDLVIIDETSKAMPPELAIALTLGKKIVLIGDHKQLPPMIDEQEFGEAMRCMGEEEFYNELNKKEYQTCLFEKLFLSAPEAIRTSLDTQYRMHSQIMRCIQQFYMDQQELSEGLKAGVDDADREHGLMLPPFVRPDFHAIWINTEGVEKKVGNSCVNELEIQVVTKVLDLLERADGMRKFASTVPERDKEIGVISYYKAQVDRLQKSLQDKQVHGLRVSAKTVDRFQGMERDIIVMSTVRSSRNSNGKNSSIGFAKDTKRINVGMSRAKRLLIVIGDRGLFENHKEYKDVIRQMKKIEWNTIKNL